MSEKNRLIPILEKGKVIALITFYIGNGNVSKYVRDNMWSVLEDEPKTGDTCYIDHLLVPGKHYHKYTWRVWRKLRMYIAREFPRVNLIRWNRIKGDKSNVHIRSLRRHSI